jgi:hypothetical protein
MSVFGKSSYHDVGNTPTDYYFSAVIISVTLVIWNAEGETYNSDSIMSACLNRFHSFDVCCSIYESLPLEQFGPNFCIGVLLRYEGLRRRRKVYW